MQIIKNNLSFAIPLAYLYIRTKQLKKETMENNETLINFMGFMNGITSDNINPDTKELLITMFNMLIDINEKLDMIIDSQDDEE